MNIDKVYQVKVNIKNIGFIQTWQTCNYGEAGGKSCPFYFEKSKKMSKSWKKALIVSIFGWVKFSIQNVVLTVSRRKNSKVFPSRAPFFRAFLTKWLSKCLNFIKPPLPWKMSGCAPALGNNTQKVPVPNEREMWLPCFE